MKFINICALLLCFTAILSSNLPGINEKDYKIVVLGDFGQINELESLTKYKFTDTQMLYLFKDNQCVLPLTFANFEFGVLPFIEKIDANEAIVLGDAVYTEGKGIGKLIDTDNNVKQEFHMRLKCAWEKVKKIFMTSKQEYLKTKTSIVFGNHAMDVNYLRELQHLSSFLPWRTFYKSNEDAKSQLSEGSSSLQKMLIGRSLGELLQKKKKIKSKGTKVFEKPLISYSNEDKILFLDFDMSKLMCSKNFGLGIDESQEKINEYAECLENEVYAGKSPKFTTPELRLERAKEHLAYLKFLVSVLETVKTNEKAKSATWRIIRVHQPIFNIERDYYGVKNNKELMKLFKEAHFHLWLVSHHHSAQINFAKYESLTYQYLFKKDNKQKRLEYMDVIKEESPNVSGTHYDLSDFFYNDDGSLKNAKATPISINRCKALFLNGTNNECTIYLKKENTGDIIQLLAGNSGRKLDPLVSDLFSDSYMLYGRAKPKEFGFYTLTFNGPQVVVEFYNGPMIKTELEAKDKSWLVEGEKNEAVVNFKLTIILDDNKTVHTSFKKGASLNKLLKKKLKVLEPLPVK